MKKTVQITAAILFSCVVLTSCFTTTHVVGSGGTGETTKAKQWFALWGLVPINSVNTQQMAAGKTDYTVTTKFTFGDMVIGAITGIVTIRPMSVEVKK
jgi:predicted small secreted protein